MLGQMFLIGGLSNSPTERDNFQLSTSNNSFVRLPNLPIGFSYGRCESFQGGTVGMICSPLNAQKDCYITFDGRTYEYSGSLTYNHYYGWGWICLQRAKWQFTLQM